MGEVYKQFGKIVRKYRKQKNYSTQKLAEILNVSTGLINNIENGKNDVFKLDLFISLVEELEIPPEDLGTLFNSKPYFSFTQSNPQEFILELKTKSNNSQILIKESLSKIINLYINVLEKSNYDKRLIELLSNSISQQLEVILLVQKTYF